MNLIDRLEAKNQGLRRYATGKPCHKGHIGERYVRNHGCVICEYEKIYAKYRNEALEKKKLKESLPRQFYLLHGEQVEIISRKEAKNKNLQRYFTGVPCKSGHICEKYTSNGKCLDCCLVYEFNYCEAKKEKSKVYYEINGELVRYKANKWAKDNPGIVNARNVKRKANKLQATPVFANDELILTFYIEAERLSVETGIKHHVDHIVPLQSDLV
ncbi:MAG TPA: hypothetical protein VN922_09195, partial [Bacteroidia bacterium]|nr:hypothetical protein [Bacteroidia bacterium]